MGAENLNQTVEIHGNCLFVSDAHFLIPPDTASLHREDLLCSLFDNFAELNHLFLLGDIFDFWFEYDDVVPRGYVKLFHKLSEMSQQGVEIHYFTGNHDMWVKTYFEEIFNAKIYRSWQRFNINGKLCVVGHGDGIGGVQRKYNLVKKIFNFAPNKLIYSMLHPHSAFRIAKFFSNKSRKSHSVKDLSFHGEEEFQVMFARDFLAEESADIFIFGHRHVPVQYSLRDEVLFFNTGDWLKNYSFITFFENKKTPELNFFNITN